LNVLGLYGLGMNPGACLLRDGRLVAFAEEERFTRLKGSHGLFPGRAASWCLECGELALADVDRIAFAWDAEKYPLRMLGRLSGIYLRHRGRALRRGAGRLRGRNGHADATWRQALGDVLAHRPARLREEIRRGLAAHGHRGAPPIEFVAHHLCHAYSAYFCSPFEAALVLTLDGSGEDVSTQLAVGRGERLEVAEAIPIPHSLGWFYAAFTAYFGFEPYRDEGKLMGLAALGHARAAGNPWPERLARILPITAKGYRVDPLYTRLGDHSFDARFTDALADFVTGFDPRLVPLRAADPGREPAYLARPYVDLAFGVQARLEQAARALVERAAREHGLSDVCIAGGVGLNCKMNGSLLAASGIERVFVQPAAYDAGTAIGAAMVVAQAGGDRIRNPLEHAHSGPAFGGAEIRAALREAGAAAEECADVVARAAEELARGRIVGWFQGSLELGPRALGGRSILANPSVPGIRDRLNREVKHREPWRPFCPSILERAAPEYLRGARRSPFMTTAFEVEPGRSGQMLQAMHVDGTARPQTVAPVLGRYHELLEEFEARTGLPFAINTSFNDDGEPIVCTPRDALRTFYACGIDVLVLGDFVLSKK
jgi:carbamoyltransferase